MEPTLTKLVTRETLRRLAGQRSFERGEEYATIGAVGSLQWDDASIRAGVQGAKRYRVRLEMAGGKLAGSCTCPVGRDGLFCKHCVAVGLAWLSRMPERDERAAAPTRSQLHDRLAALGADTLAGLLVEQALDDEYPHARLLALTADASPSSLAIENSPKEPGRTNQSLVPGAASRGAPAVTGSRESWKTLPEPRAMSMRSSPCSRPRGGRAARAGGQRRAPGARRERGSLSSARGRARLCLPPARRRAGRRAVPPIRKGVE